MESITFGLLAVTADLLQKMIRRVGHEWSRGCAQNWCACLASARMSKSSATGLMIRTRAQRSMLFQDERQVNVCRIDEDRDGHGVAWCTQAAHGIVGQRHHSPLTG